MDQKELLVGAPLHPPRPQVSVFSDASQQGWGVELDNLSLAGRWNSFQASQHSNIREMMAMIRGLEGFKETLKNQVVMLVSDNLTAVSHVQKRGGTHSWILYCKTLQLFRLAERMGITLRARWMPGKELIGADSLSRMDQIMHAEWSLQYVVCKRLFSLFPGISVDLFATFENKRLPSFVSPFPDERALAVDAFSLSWEGLKAYAFPPFKMIGPVLRKIQEDRGFVILIAPAWAGQAWFPMLLDLLVDFPR